MTGTGWWCAVAFLSLGCAERAASPVAVVESRPLVSAKRAPAKRAPANGSSVEREAPAPGPSAFRGPALTIQLVRELDHPVTHIALDKPPHAAALVSGSTSAFVHDNEGWQEVALPVGLRNASGLDLRVFFGRDYRIRVVGARIDRGLAESVYLRWLPGGLRPAFDELGQLGNSRSGPLVAVLGTQDPELVCRPTELCLVKRTTGWAKLPAPADLRLLAISRGQGFAVVGKQLLRAAREWQPVGAPGSWEDPSALFVLGDRAFVLEARRKLVHELEDGVWHAFESSVGSPRALWAANVGLEPGPTPTPDALWLVGDTGISYFDGATWRAVSNAPTDLYAVLGRSADDVWFGGSSGLYRLEGGVRQPSSSPKMK